MSKKRFLTINTPHGAIKTPVFMPDATYGAVSNMTGNDLKASGVKELVTTTLHLEQKLGSEYIQELGGIHKFMGWDRPILTDSGGFQVFSLIHRSNTVKQNLVTDVGASFIDYADGSYNFLSPERSIQIQHLLGSDIRVVLDEPVLHNDSLKNIRNSVKRTTEWAKRSKDAFLGLAGISEKQFADTTKGRPLLTAVIQGANSLKYRRQSAEQLSEIDFDVYGFGGIPVHSELTWKEGGPTGFYHDLIAYVAELIPKDKIRYGLGMGTPDDLIFAHSVGWDIFDSVLPTRNARHGYLYVHQGEGDQEFQSYSALHIKSMRYKYDQKSVDEKCKCECCTTVSRAYLRHLIRIKSGTGFRLATIHNLSFYSEIMENIRTKRKL